MTIGRYAVHRSLTVHVLSFFEGALTCVPSWSLGFHVCFSNMLSDCLKCFQTLNDGDMALMDMGAEYHFYGSDITCSYPVSTSKIRHLSVYYLELFVPFSLLN